MREIAFLSYRRFFFKIYRFNILKMSKRAPMIGRKLMFNLDFIIDSKLAI